MATHPVFLPGEFPGLYSSWGHKELDMTEQLSLHFTTVGIEQRSSGKMIKLAKRALLKLCTEKGFRQRKS